jgi:hypothetical protein
MFSDVGFGRSRSSENLVGVSTEREDERTCSGKSEFFGGNTWTLSNSLLRAVTNIILSDSGFDITWLSQKRGRICQLAILIFEVVQTRADGHAAEDSENREGIISLLDEHFERQRREEGHDTASRKLQSC